MDPMGDNEINPFNLSFSIYRKYVIPNSLKISLLG